jgi:hypothetical protein
VIIERKPMISDAIFGGNTKKFVSLRILSPKAMGYPLKPYYYDTFVPPARVGSPKPAVSLTLPGP